MDCYNAYFHGDLSENWEVCGVSFVTTEQHVDSRVSRIARDESDVQKFVEWFTIHNPFPVGDCIVSISTGLMGDETINCHLAVEAGMSSISKIIGNNFSDVKFQRKERVMPLKGIQCTIRAHNEDCLLYTSRCV